MAWQVAWSAIGVLVFVIASRKLLPGVSFRPAVRCGGGAAVVLVWVGHVLEQHWGQADDGPIAWW